MFCPNSSMQADRSLDPWGRVPGYEHNHAPAERAPWMHWIADLERAKATLHLIYASVMLQGQSYFSKSINASLSKQTLAVFSTSSQMFMYNIMVSICYCLQYRQDIETEICHTSMCQQGILMYITYLCFSLFKYIFTCIMHEELSK